MPRTWRNIPQHCGVYATFLRITESSRFWDFYEHEGKPLFLAPKSRLRFRITGEITGFQGEVSAEAAGIIATLFGFSHLSFQYQSEHLSAGYGRLYAYAADHPEAAEIFQAID